jgi:Holliday junction DNA helicase RuvA
MITSLRGLLLSKAPTEVVVEVGGVGYGIHIPLSTFEAIADPPAEVHLLTHLHVREDALVLFGFATAEEREMFRLLIAVNGIGPRMAQGILSGIPAGELRGHIASSNLGALTRIPGVGRKIAERLVIELREKLSRLGTLPPAAGGSTAGNTAVREEALLALTSLGYSKSAAERAIRGALQELAQSDPTVEVLLKAALRNAARS